MAKQKCMLSMLKLRSVNIQNQYFIQNKLCTLPISKLQKTTDFLLKIQTFGKMRIAQPRSN